MASFQELLNLIRILSNSSARQHLPTSMQSYACCHLEVQKFFLVSNHMTAAQKKGGWMATDLTPY